MYFNYFSMPLVVAAMLTAILGYMILPYRSTPGVKYFSCLLFSAAVYSLFYALEISSGELIRVEIFYKLQYIGIPFIPAFFLLFASGYTRNNDVRNPLVLILIFAIPVLTALFAFTSNLHDFFIREARLDNTGPFQGYIFSAGPWYMVNQVYAMGTVLLSIILLFRMYITAAPAIRNQAGVVLAGSIVPFLIYLLYIAGIFPGGLDANPFSYTISGVIIFIGIYRYKLFSISPLARNILFDNIPDAVAVLDHEMRLVDMNKPAACLFALENSAIGRFSTEVFKKWPDILQNMRGDAKTKYFEFSLNNADDIRYLKCTIIRLQDNHNTERGKMLVAKDVTVERKAESEKYENEKKIKKAFVELERINNEKDRFFSILSHDLRSPFTAFLGYTDFLEESLDTEPVESVRSIVKSMKDSANSLYGLLENLLQWSSMQQGLVYFNPEELFLSDKILKCIEPLLVSANKKMIDVNYDIPSGIKIVVDPKMFETIIRNLFTNAVKFTPKLGSIEIFSSETLHGHVDICFSDSGIGMDKEMVSKLFKLDVKISRAGTDGELSTGLGLILVREFVKMNGGSMWVESEVNRGSHIYIRLRLAPAMNI